MTETTIEVSFVFEGPQVKGTFTRVLELEGGIPTSFKGDKLPVSYPEKGILDEIFTDIDKSKQE